MMLRLPTLFVQVFDWQHSATVDPAYPNPANPGGLRESSKVASLEVYLPYLISNPVVATIPESGNGTPSISRSIQDANKKRTIIYRFTN